MPPLDSIIGESRVFDRLSAALFIDLLPVIANPWNYVQDSGT